MVGVRLHMAAYDLRACPPLDTNNAEVLVEKHVNLPCLPMLARPLLQAYLRYLEVPYVNFMFGIEGVSRSHLLTHARTE